MNSGGAQQEQQQRSHMNSQPTNGPQGGNKDIVKATPDSKVNNAESDQVNEPSISIEDEDVKTFLSFLSNANSDYKIATLSTHKAHTNYWSMLATSSSDLCIPDGGADSHVGGRTWLPLTPLSGPLVKFANVTGFDEHSAKKFGLPIITGVTKTVNEKGDTILLRAKHLIYNATSPHSLLSTYQMRELGIVVDDVTKRHPKDLTTHGTHSITFPKANHVIELATKGALSTFDVEKPTMQEYLHTPEENIVDIALENWNPQEHHEELLETKPSIALPVTACHSTALAHDLDYFSDCLDPEVCFNEAFANICASADIKVEEVNEDQEIFVDCEEDEFHDTQ